MGYGEALISHLLRRVPFLISYENSFRNIYALGILLRFDGRASPARIKHELKKDKLMSYKTFLKAIKELERAGMVRKEFGEYIIIQDYIPHLQFLLKEIPSKLMRIMDDFFNEKITYQTTKAELGEIIEILSKKYHQFTTNFYLEVCWIMDIYLVHSSLGIVEYYVELGDIQDIIKYVESLKETKTNLPIKIPIKEG